MLKKTIQGSLIVAAMLSAHLTCAVAQTKEGQKTNTLGDKKEVTKDGVVIHETKGADKIDKERKEAREKEKADEAKKK
jgi:hypothetical protein